MVAMRPWRAKERVECRLRPPEAIVSTIYRRRSSFLVESPSTQSGSGPLKPDHGTNSPPLTLVLPLKPGPTARSGPENRSYLVDDDIAREAHVRDLRRLQGSDRARDLLSCG